jgi:hypothetical protein
MAGPFYFAWVLVGTAFNEDAHLVEDEDIFGLEISHAEGDFAVLHLDIKNPRIGLLNSGRKQWCWLSRDTGTEIKPLFNGRLIGVPESIKGEIVRLTFLAKPEGFADLKSDLAETLKVLPYYDPVWIETTDAALDTVLEARSLLWHIDRVTLDVTTSDIIVGEAGTLEFTADDHFYDNLEASYSDRPLKKIEVTAEAGYTQTGAGSVDLTRKLWQAFKSAGSPYDYPLISSLTGDGLLSAWPAADSDIGGGWTVSKDSTIKAATTETTISTNGSYRKSGWVKPYVYRAKYYNGLLKTQDSTDPDAVGSDITNSFFKAWGDYTVDFPLGVYSIKFVANWKADRKRLETLKFTIEADVADPGGIDDDRTTEKLQLTSQYVDQPVDPDDALPIGDTTRASYFQTDRGVKSFEYVINLARAKLLARARCVAVTLRTEFDRALDLSCRHSVMVHDDRLPDGVATGKVTSYRLTAGGQDGAQYAEITIGCTVGRGNPVTAIAGTGVHHDDYSDGYQVETGGTILIPSADVTYETLDDFVVANDGLDLQNVSPTSAIDELTIAGGLTAQVTTINTNSVGNYADPIGALKALPTEVTLKLKSVTAGTFKTIFEPEMSLLSVPQTIDLEAEAL